MTDIPVPTNIFTGHDGDKLCDIIFTEEEVLKRLLCLREDKSAGVDEMSSRFLKAICHEITLPVTLLFNLSMSGCKVPHDWKLANITPIYKQGSRNSPEKNRPISLTCHLSKVMESTQ